VIYAMEGLIPAPNGGRKVLDQLATRLTTTWGNGGDPGIRRGGRRGATFSKCWGDTQSCRLLAVFSQNVELFAPTEGARSTPTL